MRLLAVLGIVFGLGVCVPGAEAAPEGCPLELWAGQISAVSGPSDSVEIVRNRAPLTFKLPTCVEFGDVVTISPRGVIRAQTVSETKDVAGEWVVPEAVGRKEGSMGGFWLTLARGVFGPTRAVSFYATSRGGASCPAGTGMPPPLAAVVGLPPGDQVVGSDLRAVVALWRPAAEARLVHARLLRPDGSVLASAVGCGGPTLPILLRAGALQAGDHLVLDITDEQGGALRYGLTVVAPDRLPQPPSPGEDWMVGAWRLMAGDPATHLDAVSRVARASETSFGAQRVLGSVLEGVAF